MPIYGSSHLQLLVGNIRKFYFSFFIKFHRLLNLKEAINPQWKINRAIRKKSVLQIDRTGSLGIPPTQDCTHSLKIVFVVAGGGLYSYYIHQGNKSDKERIIARKMLSFMHIKRLNTFFSKWVQSRVGLQPWPISNYTTLTYIHSNNLD